jgi:O-antigen/teichoic acid export membrane protein
MTSTESLSTDLPAVADRWSRVLRGGVSGISTKLVATAIGFVATPIVLSLTGNTRYGVFTAVTAMTAFFGFADLGLGNGLVSRLAAAIPLGREQSRKVISDAWRLTLLLAGAVVCLGTVLTFSLPWAEWLRVGPNLAGEIRPAVYALVVLLAAGIPLGIVQKTLMAQQRMHLSNLWLAGGVAAGAAGLLTAAELHARLWVMVAGQIGGPVLVSLISACWLWGIDAPHLRPAGSLVTRDGMRALLGVGGMYFVLQIAVALNYQIDTLIVAHYRSPDDVTTFAITAKLFSLPIALVGAALLPLWPAFAHARESGDLTWARLAWGRATRYSAMFLVPIAVALAPAAPWLGRVWTHGHVSPPLGLCVGWAAWLVVFALNSPQAMLLNGLQLLKFQVATAVVMTVTNVGLSVSLTQIIGVSGPVWGSVVAQVICTLVPTTIYLRRRLAVRATEQVRP